MDAAGSKALARRDATSAMTHIALQENVDGKNVQWMEQVTDAQYSSTEGS